MTWRDSEVTFTFALSEDDPGVRGHAKLVGDTTRIRFPISLGPDDVHPDLEALAAVLIVRPFTGGTLAVDRPVTTAMESAVARTFKIRIGPVDEGLEPRARPSPGLPGLAFSGGADSTAAVAVMPRTTVCGFMQRIPPEREFLPTIYRDEAALHACAALQSQGRSVHVIQTDLEYLRDPVGFPTDWANAIGMVLLADRLQLQSIGWGLIAESAYRVGHEVYADWALRRAGWARLFGAAGLHFNAPVAGVSEVGTTKIVSQSSLGGVFQSCIRGGVGSPCGDCWKCFRKSLLDAAITGEWPDDDDMDRLFAIREVDLKLAKLPIPHEDVLGWIAGRYPGTHPKMRLLRRRALPEGETFSWLEHWYGPSIDLVDEGHALEVATRLDEIVGRMSPDEEARFRAWDMTTWLADPDTRTAAETLLGHGLDELAPRRPASPLAKPPGSAERVTGSPVVEQVMASPDRPPGSKRRSRLSRALRRIARRAKRIANAKRPA